MSKYKELVKKLKEIFQIDRPELDFGIYRILNAKGDEINDYLENTLKKKISDALATAGNANKEELEKQLAGAIKGAEALGVDPETIPKVKDLRLQIVASSQGANEHENAVFTHLLSFFSRYYDSGDFVSKRRYKGDTYAIPYAGEEVMLHWANKDQYYIKSGENFANYSFKLDDGRKVSFKLLTADTAKDNRKDNDADRRFVLIERHTRRNYDDEGNEYEEEYSPISNMISEDCEELIIQFEYKAMKKGTVQSESIPQRKKGKLGLNELTLIKIKELISADWSNIFERLPTESNANRTLLEKHLTTYTQRNTADYFIHKDLHGFLSNELDFYIKNEVMNLDNVQNAEVFADIEKQIRMIQCLRSIASDVILFLSQLENFQKRLWEKRKFVVETNYLITLDKVNVSLIDDMANDSDLTCFFENEVGISNTELLDRIKSNDLKGLLFDTKFLPLKYVEKILNTISSLDDSLSGTFFWSDNYHALALLQNKFSESVQSIYIDPPYNTENDGFLYKDSYRESSWLSMMYDRLRLGGRLIKKGGSQGVSIDLKELDNCLKLCDEVYGKDSRKSNIAIKRGSLTGAKMINPGPVNINENLILYSKEGATWKTEKAYREKDYDKRYGSTIVNIDEHYSNWRFSTVLEEFSQHVGIAKSKLKKHFGEKYEKSLLDWIMDNAERIIQFAGLDENAVSKDAKALKAESLEEPEKLFYLQRDGANDYYLRNGSVMLFYKHRLIKLGEKLVPGERLSDLWDDVLPNDIHTEGGVSLRKGKKPEKLLHRFIELTTKKSDLVIDYFAGSGTTASVALKSGRKFITIDQQDFSKLRDRVINTLKGDKTGVSKICDWQGSGIVKYQLLESYEDVLNNIELKKPQQQLKLLDELSEDAKSDYLLNYMLETESKGSLLSTDDFKKPFDYKMKISVDSAGASEEKNIDLVETFNYLIGLHINTIESNVERGYVRIEGELPSGERALVLWRDCEKIQYDDFTKFSSRFDLFAKQKTFDVIYVNGDHNLPTAFTNDEGEVTRTLKLRQIEPVFLEQMFAPDDLV